MKLALVLVALLVAGVALAHGLTGFPDPPGAQFCACANASDSYGIVDPCSSGGSYYSGQLVLSQPAPICQTCFAPVLTTAKLRRMVDRLRRKMTEAPATP